MGSRYRRDRVPSRNGAADYVSAVPGTQKDGDASTDAIERSDALCAADSDDFVALIQRVLDRVLTELPEAPMMHTFNCVLLSQRTSGFTARNLLYHLQKCVGRGLWLIKLNVVPAMLSE